MLKVPIPSAAPAAPVLCWPQTFNELRFHVPIRSNPSFLWKRIAKVRPFPELASTFFNYFSFIFYLTDLQIYKNAVFSAIPEFYGAISSKKGCSRVSVWKVLAGSGGWSQVLPSSFPGFINGRTLLYIGSIHSWTHRTWRARLVCPSDILSPISSRPVHPSRPRSGIPILSEQSSHVFLCGKDIQR